MNTWKGLIGLLSICLLLAIVHLQFFSLNLGQYLNFQTIVSAESILTEDGAIRITEKIRVSFIPSSNFDAAFKGLTILPHPKVVQYDVDSLKARLALYSAVEFEIHGLDAANDLNATIASTINRFVKRSRHFICRPVCEDLHYISYVQIFLGEDSIETELRKRGFSDRYNDTEGYFDEYLIHLPDPNHSHAIQIYSYDHRGLLAALGSLSQLLSSPLPIHLPMVIYDWAKYEWRGLMIDVARHFQPIPLLKRTIDAMEVSKLNVLHLHLTDSQSFPILLDDIPINDEFLHQFPHLGGNKYLFQLSQLAIKGSFDAKRKIYTKRDLLDLIQYAHQRGIQIIPEIDVPSHTLSWANAFPSLLVNCTSYVHRKQTPHNIFTLNPILPETKLVIREILKQIVEIFSDSPHIHIGGDEVHADCWLEDELIRGYIKEHDTSITEIFHLFEKELIDYVQQTLGKRVIVWQGLLDEEVISSVNGSQDVIVQPWKCWDNLSLRAAVKAVHQQYPVVMAGCWYLDYDTDWATYLATDVIVSAITALSRETDTPPRRVLAHSEPQGVTAAREASNRHVKDYFYGGEASMWTEKVDHSNLECRVWPRMIAVASRLWGNDPTLIGEVLPFHSDGNHRRLHLPSPGTVEHSPNYGTLDYWRARILSGDTAGGGDLHRQLGSYLVAAVATYRLTAEQTNQLFAAFAQFRYYLVDLIGVAAANLIFHERGSGRSGAMEYIPSIQTAGQSLQQTLRKILSLNDSSVIMSNGGHLRFHSNRVYLTSRCLGIPEEIQRPIDVSSVRIAQLNVAEGSVGKRGEHMLAWLRDKAKAGFLLVGFCELNGWQASESKTDLNKNIPNIAFKAASAGFSHYHVMDYNAHGQPFNIGLVSTLAFDILGQYGPPDGYQRGVLHVYYSSLDLHVFIVHLHAHSSKQREVECRLLLEIIQPLLEEHRKVMIMGDFNTLSPVDKRLHEEAELPLLFSRSDQPEYARYKKKFTVDDQINYEPMAILLRGGLHDSCVASCLQVSQLPIDSSLGHQWTLKGSDPLSVCMRQNCAYTEPTQYNPEWSPRDAVPHPAIRLDYILVSEAIIQHEQLNARVDIDDATHSISDHYPVMFSWKYDVSRDCSSLNEDTCSPRFPLY